MISDRAISVMFNHPGPWFRWTYDINGRRVTAYSRDCDSNPLRITPVSVERTAL